MAKFMVIGERIHCISPAMREAFETRNPEPILQRAKEQLDAGADYLDLNIGPAEKDGEELMQWGVKLLQENFDNVPLALDTANMKAIEAGIQVYNREKGKPLVNSADAGDRIGYLDLAAANDAAASAYVLKKVYLLIMTNVSLTALNSLKEVWNMAWNQPICCLTHWRSLSRVCRTNKKKCLKPLR